MKWSAVDAGVDPRPGRAVVARLVEIGAEVVRLVHRRRDVGAPLVERAGVDLVDHDPLRQPLGRDVLPALAAVAGDVDQAVVGAGPDHARLERRLGDVEDRVVVLDAGVVLGDRAARGALPRLVVARQVGRDHRPALAAVGALEQHLGGGVERARVVGREDDGEVPLEAVLEVGGAGAHRVVRPGVDVAELAGGMVQAGEQAAVGAAVDDVGVLGVGDDVAALAARRSAPSRAGPMPPPRPRERMRRAELSCCAPRMR